MSEPMSEPIVLSEEIQLYDLKHFPIVVDYARRMGLVETINQCIPSEMDVPPGEFVLLMVLDTLSGRSPLYLLSQFAATLDLEFLLGQPFRPEQFHDDSAGQLLDKIYEYGSMKLFTTCALRACQAFDVPLVYLHHDTTKVLVQGDYLSSQDDDSPFSIQKGYNPKKRTDLKQFVLSLLCVSRNIPLWASYEDGNASDKVLNNQLLSDLSGHLAGIQPEMNQWLFVADSALITEENLGLLSGTFFVSRLPATFNEHSRVIETALEQVNWVDIGTLNQTPASKSRPAAFYRVSEQKVELYGVEYRAVVVHSSAHDGRRQKKMKRELEESLKLAKEAQSKAQKQEFSCELDATNALERWKGEYFAYHKLEGEVQQRLYYGRGRPPKDKPREVNRTSYVLSMSVEEKTEKVEQRKRQAGCFVLISNAPTEGELSHDAKALLSTYKEQIGVENNFRFLKDPLIVNRLFLEKPERLEALGALLLLSLLIWRLMERSMRSYVKENETRLEGYDKKRSERPTGRMVVLHFARIQVVSVGGARRMVGGLSEVQKEYLRALGVEEKVFKSPVVLGARGG